MNKNIKKNQYETCVKPLKSEFISLVTTESVRQYYDEQDFNSQKLEQSKLFRNKVPPPHHYRYLPNNVKPNKKKDTKVFGLILSSEDKVLTSYFLIYIIVFVCSITLLYLFYTPRNMNLFGFYNDKDLKLKFYQYVRKKPNNMTSKKIIPTEQTKVYTTEQIKNFTEFYSTSTTTEITTSTFSPKVTKETSFTTEKNGDKSFTSTTNSIIGKINLVSSKKPIITKTTCIPINETESIDTDDKINYSTTSYSNEILKNVSIIENDSNIQASTEANLNKKESFIAKDNTTETIEFQEKISYSNNSHVLKAEKNETIDDETLVDNGILPTEEEEEEKRKDELESKIKIASFFGLDDQTKLKNKLSFEKTKLTTQVENYKALIEEEFKQKNEKKPDKWKIKFKDQKNNNEFYFDTKSENKNEEDLKYQPMLRLILGSCNGGCSKF